MYLFNLQLLNNSILGLGHNMGHKPDPILIWERDFLPGSMHLITVCVSR